MTRLAWSARAVLWTAIVVFGAMGLLGVATSWFEFRWLYPVELLGDEVTVRNQQRFLKSLELAWAVALYLLRRDVFVRRAPTLAVLFVFVATPLARGVSMAVDGLPHPDFVALFGVESLAATVLLLRAWQTRTAWQPSTVPRPAPAANEAGAPELSR